MRADIVTFPRSVKPVGTTGPPEIVGFWDGGDPAFGCCLYARYKLEQQGSSGETHAVRLLAGKARVTPIKRNTTPRSELSGLLVLSRLLSSLWDRFSKRPSRVSILV